MHRTLLIFLVTAFAFANPASRPAKTTNLVRPLTFEPNRGQEDPRVKYLAQGEKHTLFLTQTGAVLKGSDGSRLTMTVKGASIDSPLQPENALPSHSNYFYGQDPSKWVTNVPHFARIRQPRVLPGIDLVFYGNNNAFEYDFIVQPGVDPNTIALHFSGASHIAIDANGDLLLHTPSATLRQPKPVVYQGQGATRREIPSSYQLHSNNEVTFAIAPYDTTRPLTIDPSLVFSTFLGGAGNESVTSIARQGFDTWVTGSTSSLRFAFESTDHNHGGFDIFVTRFSNTGALVFNTFIGGGNTDLAFAIAVDSNQEAHVTGQTVSTDFPTVAPTQPNRAGSVDMFLLRLSALGNNLLFSTFHGGSGLDAGWAIALSGTQPHVAGFTTSTDFPAAGTHSGDYDLFYLRKTEIVPGIPLLQGRLIGGTNYEEVGGITVDKNGKPWIIGTTSSANLPGAVNSLNGVRDAFVTKIKFTSLFGISTPQVDFTRYIGGSGHESGESIASNQNAVFLTGSTGSTNFPTLGFPSTVFGQDAFLMRLDFNGTPQRARLLGGARGEFPGAVAVNSSDHLHVVGITDSTDFPLINSPGAPFLSSPAGGFDVFIARFDGNLNIDYTARFGGPTSETCLALAIDSNGVIALGGLASAPGIPMLGAIQSTPAGLNDGWLMVVNP